MNIWIVGKINETLLEKDFYSHLNMEDIADALMHRLHMHKTFVKILK